MITTTIITIINREAIQHFCELDENRCLVVPDSMKLDKVIPSKLSKGKVLLFVKLRPCTLKMDNIQSDVSYYYYYY